MKAIVCGLCADVRALRDGYKVSCECGNVTGWWVDPAKGTAEILAYNRDKARVMGISNTVIRAAFSVPYDLSHQRWREIHEEETAQATGYLFHKDSRACPFVIANPGNVSGVSFVPLPQQS